MILKDKIGEIIIQLMIEFQTKALEGLAVSSIPYTHVYIKQADLGH